MFSDDFVGAYRIIAAYVRRSRCDDGMEAISCDTLIGIGFYHRLGLLKEPFL